MTRKSYKNSHEFKRKMANNSFVLIYAVKLLLAFSIPFFTSRDEMKDIFMAKIFIFFLLYTN